MAAKHEDEKMVTKHENPHVHVQVSCCRHSCYDNDSRYGEGDLLYLGPTSAINEDTLT